MKIHEKNNAIRYKNGDLIGGGTMKTHEHQRKTD